MIDGDGRTKPPSRTERPKSPPCRDGSRSPNSLRPPSQLARTAAGLVSPAVTNAFCMTMTVPIVRSIPAGRNVPRGIGGTSAIGRAAAAAAEAGDTAVISTLLRYVVEVPHRYRIRIRYSDTPIHHRYSYREVSRKKINIINLDTPRYTSCTVSGKYRHRETKNRMQAARF
jgi:hypothetical protein